MQISFHFFPCGYNQTQIVLGGFFLKGFPLFLTLGLFPGSICPTSEERKGIFLGASKAAWVCGCPGSGWGVEGLKISLRERTFLPGDNISILSHSVFSVIEEVQVL